MYNVKACAIMMLADYVSAGEENPHSSKRDSMNRGNYTT